MNLIIHGVEEQSNEVRGNRERIEKDKERCERIFVATKARTRKDDIRFCRRIGERGDDPRPMVIGLENEEEKRHLLGRARELRNTRYSDISIVLDLTRKQRNREARMKEEAEEKNKELTEEEKRRNVKWMVVGRRGEKRIIKGVERDQQPYTRDSRRDEQNRNNQNQSRDEQRENRKEEVNREGVVYCHPFSRGNSGGQNKEKEHGTEKSRSRKEGSWERGAKHIGRKTEEQEHRTSRRGTRAGDGTATTTDETAGTARGRGGATHPRRTRCSQEADKDSKDLIHQRTEPV
jgi:hypothetical protein